MRGWRGCRRRARHDVVEWKGQGAEVRELNGYESGRSVVLGASGYQGWCMVGRSLCLVANVGPVYALR